MLKFLPVILVVALLGAFAILKLLTYNRKYKRSREQVADLLDSFLGEESGWRAWDTFLSFPLKDEKLERIRIRCANLDREFPPDTDGHFCGDKAIDVIRTYIAELRKPWAANSRRK
jgi:hypothetical protein